MSVSWPLELGYMIVYTTNGTISTVNNVHNNINIHLENPNGLYETTPPPVDEVVRAE